MRPDAPHILVVRLSAIGDVIMSSSLLPALHERYPGLRITWLTEPVGAEILEGNDLVDTVITLPRRAWEKRFKSGRVFPVATEIRALVRRLRQSDFDCVIDLQGITKSAIWAFLSGCPQRISLRGRELSKFLMTEIVPQPTTFGGPLCHEYRVLAQQLGLPTERFRMHIPPQEAYVRKARARFAGQSGRPVLLFPFTTRPQKHWFEDRWVALARRLAERPETSVWILGGPGDAETAGAIADRAGLDPAAAIAGPETDMRDKIALVSEAALCIGVDTGLTHLGFGLDRPTIALFGSTCAYRDLGDRPGVVLFTARSCAPCRRHPTCGGTFDCMRDHGVDGVFAHAKTILEDNA